MFCHYLCFSCLKLVELFLQILPRVGRISSARNMYNSISILNNQNLREPEKANITFTSRIVKIVCNKFSVLVPRRENSFSSIIICIFKYILNFTYKSYKNITYIHKSSTNCFRYHGNDVNLHF